MALRPHGGVVPSWTSWLSTIPLGDSLSEKERMATAGKLADAVASQASFVGRILALGPRIITDEWIDRAISRYADFLQLARDHPREVLVPTLDIDLIWHAHMLSPLDYRDDCHALLGNCSRTMTRRRRLSSRTPSTPPPSAGTKPRHAVRVA